MIPATHKTLRLLLYLNDAEPADLCDLAAYVYSRKDLAGISDSVKDISLASEIKQTKASIKAMQKLGWEITLHTEGWKISARQRKLLDAVEAIYRAKHRRIAKGSLTPANVAYWVVTHGIVSVAA